MEIEDFSCPMCNILYDETTRIPRLLTKCGHTFCHECLVKNMIENQLKCPDDNIEYENISKIDELPKNLTLLNLLHKTRIRKISKTYLGKTTPQFTHSLNIISPSNHNYRSQNNLYTPRENLNFSFMSLSKNMNEMDNITLNGNNLNFNNQTTRNSFSNHYNIKNNISNFFANEFTMGEINSSSHNSFQNQANNNMCLIHRRSLEIVCLDHRLKICTSCALFGEHKAHNLKSEEDIIKDISIKAEILMEFYEIMDKTSEKFETDMYKNIENLERLKQSANEKSKKMKEVVKTFIRELRFLLKTKEQQLVEEIEEKIDIEMIKKINFLIEYPEKLKVKISNWKKE